MHLISRSLRRFIVTDGRCCQSCHRFSTTVPISSGHNRWSKIKHDKGKEDATKNKQRSVLAHELIQASKQYGADPNINPKLAQTVATAKKAGFPKASIEACIARGQGFSTSGAALENITVEAIIPPSVATVIDCQTDSKARTLQDLRLLIRDHGGTVTPTSYLFEKKGKIVFERAEGMGVDEVLDDAVEAGATDIEEDEDGRLVVYTEPSETKSTADGLTAAKGLKVESSEIIWDPKPDTLVEVKSDQEVKSVDDFLEAVQDNPSVQNVYLNVA